MPWTAGHGKFPVIIPPAQLHSHISINSFCVLVGSTSVAVDCLLLVRPREFPSHLTNISPHYAPDVHSQGFVMVSLMSGDVEELTLGAGSSRVHTCKLDSG